MMQIGKQASAYTLIGLLIAPLVGCGSSGAPITSTSTAGPSGKVIQGAVNGATVFADNLSSGTRLTADSSESSTQTTTNSSGSYTLPQSPTYKAVVVSQGGTDGLTGKTALTMLSPLGAQSVSPLTSLVMLDASGKLATTLSGILPNNASFDSDFTQPGAINASSLMFVTAVTSAMTTLNEAIQTAAKTGGATVSGTQLAVVNALVFTQLAAQFSTLTPAQLSNTASLATTLQAGLGNAISTIVSTNTNLVIPNSVAASIANNSVAAAAVVVGNATNNAALKAVTASNVQSGSGVSAGTATLTESSVITGANLSVVVSAITSTAASVATSVTVTSTPSNYTPPPITIAQNPSVAGYSLIATASGSAYSVRTFTITFSDAMVASQSGASDYAHSVLNPANYTFSQSGCTPTSYASNTVTFTCSSNLQAGVFVATVLKANGTTGVWASSTSLGLLVNVSKSFTLPFITGGTGGTVSLF